MRVKWGEVAQNIKRGATSRQQPSKDKLQKSQRNGKVWVRWALLDPMSLSVPKQKRKEQKKETLSEVGPSGPISTETVQNTRSLKTKQWGPQLVCKSSKRQKRETE